MLANKRERNIAFLALAMVGVFLADRYVLSPYLDSRALANSTLVNKQLELQQDLRLLKEDRLNRQRWQQMVAGGVGADVSGLEIELRRNLQNWADESRLSLGPFRTEHGGRAGQFAQLKVQVSGSGPMTAVARYLYQIQASAVPLRVTNLEIRPRREATNDLTMILSLTSIYLAPETRPGIGGSAAAPRAAAARPAAPAAESAAATHPSPGAAGRRP